MCLWRRGDSSRPSCTLACCHRSLSSISKTTGMTQSNKKNKKKNKTQNPTTKDWSNSCAQSARWRWKSLTGAITSSDTVGVLVHRSSSITQPSWCCHIYEVFLLGVELLHEKGKPSYFVTCWCSWGPHTWAAAAPASPEGGGLCLSRGDKQRGRFRCLIEL